MAKGRNGYDPLWRQPLSYPHPLWTHPFWDLVYSKTWQASFNSYHLFLRKRCTGGSFVWQWHRLLQPARKTVSAWMGVWIGRWCTYVPSGNCIAKRSHHSIKRIAARKQCTIVEATYWYNVTPKDRVSLVTTPTNVIYMYQVQAKGIDVVL